MNLHFPALSLRAEMLNTEQLSRQLHERTIDIAFTTEPLKSDDVENIAIQNSTLRLYSDDADIASSEPDNYVHIEWNNKISEAIYHTYPFAKKAVFKTSSLNIAANYMRANGGTAVLPEEVAASIKESTTLHQIDSGDAFSMTTYLVYLKDIKNSSLAEFIAFNQSHQIKS